MSNVVSIRGGGAFGGADPGGGDDSRNFRPRSILYGDRFRDLDYRESYYACTQHDSKLYDFDGRVISGPRAIQPLISAEKSPIYIPLKMRRPAAPVRMGKIIVDSFTNLLFGENRFPNIRIDGDDRSQDFAQTLARVARLPMQMIRARNLGGSVGTVGMSWCFHEGVPRFEIHNAKNLYVHSWLDRVLLLPKHVTEVYMFYKVKWDGKGFNKSYYWFRRDWTPDGDFVFADVPFEKDKDPVWEVDEEKSNRHGDGVVHFEWIQNVPTDEIDGLPDYEGLFDQFDQLDILNSVVTRGAILNLDPTLKLKMDADMVKRLGVRKGSDNALVVGLDGDASYMELAGTSIEAGTKLLESMRRSILETAQCIVPDPHEVAAQGVSSVAIKTMFAPMLSKADVFREQYAAAMKRMLENMVQVAKNRMGQTQMRPVLDEEGNPIVDPTTGEPAMEEVSFVLSLPPRVEMVPQQVPSMTPTVDPMTGAPAVDPMTGAPMQSQTIDPATGQPQMVDAVDEKGQPIVLPQKFPRVPGEGGEVSLNWPPYFAPTFDDQAKIVTAMQTATGGKAFLSTETATDIAAAAFGVDPAEERKRVQEEGANAQAQQGAMFPPAGGGPPSGGGPPGHGGFHGAGAMVPQDTGLAPPPVPAPAIFVPEG